MLKLTSRGSEPAQQHAFGVLLSLVDGFLWISPVCCILKDCLAQEGSSKSDVASVELLCEKHLSWLCAKKFFSTVKLSCRFGGFRSAMNEMSNEFENSKPQIWSSQIL